MSLINLNAVSVTLGEPLFTDLNLTLSKGDRLGLVAANGRGKSTLLSIMQGGLDPTSGNITRARGLRIGHVQQHLPDGDLSRTFHDFVGAALPRDQADFESWRVDVALEDLSVPYGLQQTPLSELSGGWQRTAMLVLRLKQPNFYLLDEPTNHLDIEGQEALEEELCTQGAACLLVSHDRSFVRNVANRFWQIKDKRLDEVPDPEPFFRAELG